MMTNFLSKNAKIISEHSSPRSLYIHIPFCERKCFYCSFVVSVGHARAIDNYLEALASEAQIYKGTPVDSIYIGGGTPSFLKEEQQEKLFALIRESFYIPDGIEWTMEANPEGLSMEMARWIRKHGVTRVSLGIQSLNEKYLKYLGRNHDRQKALEAFLSLRQAGFDNINVDLMFAFPEQTFQELESDLAAVASLNSDHVSVYALTVEPNSRFHAKKTVLPSEQIQAKQYLSVIKAFEDHGFIQYEVSNFARIGKMSRHNLMYWTGGHYIGLGVGAHSYLEGRRFWNTPRLNDYISRMREKASAVEDFEDLTPKQQFEETLLFGLRMNEGVCVDELEKKYGCTLCREASRELNLLVDGGFLFWQQGRLKTTLKGRLVLDEICARLIESR